MYRSEIHEQGREDREQIAPCTHLVLIRDQGLQQVQPIHIQRSMPMAIKHHVVAAADDLGQIRPPSRILAAVQTDRYKLCQRKGRGIRIVGGEAARHRVHVIGLIVTVRTMHDAFARQEIEYAQKHRDEVGVHPPPLHTARRCIKAG